MPREAVEPHAVKPVFIMYDTSTSQQPVGKGKATLFQTHRSLKRSRTEQNECRTQGRVPGQVPDAKPRYTLTYISKASITSSFSPLGPQLRRSRLFKNSHLTHSSLHYRSASLHLLVLGCLSQIISIFAPFRLTLSNLAPWRMTRRYVKF